MTGRGIDQILAHPVDPTLHERFVRSAERYVELAEEESGPIPAPVDDDYIWGDALDALDAAAPDARIVNLETAVTTGDDPWPGKGIHYRMHPANVGCLAAGGIDCCVLANNHVLDWGRGGLEETLETLDDAGIAAAGAGRDAREAQAPAVVDVGDGRRIVVFAFAARTSGVPGTWAAGPGRPGVSLLEDLSGATADAVAARIRDEGREGDVVVASIHWGGNWGWSVDPAERDFARRLVDDGGVDVVHGHSSHHPRPPELHRGRPIFYGCGDFINDYEGIGGRRRFRGDLRPLYLPRFGPGGGVEGIRVVTFRTRRLRLERAPDDDVTWLRETLNRQGDDAAARLEPAPGGPGGSLALEIGPAQSAPGSPT